MATAGSFYADTETGDHLHQPSTDTLTQVIGGLDQTDNTFVTLLPDSDNPTWYASVSLLADGTFEVERRDTATGEHQTTTSTDPQTIAADLIKWTTNRNAF